MTENRSTILKFVGVSSEEFLDLDVALRSSKIREENFSVGQLSAFAEYAVIKSSNWSQSYRTLTIEVEVFEFQRWCNNPGAGPDHHRYVFNENRPTPRHVIESILNALGRYKP